MISHDDDLAGELNDDDNDVDDDHDGPNGDLDDHDDDHDGGDGAGDDDDDGGDGHLMTMMVVMVLVIMTMMVVMVMMTMMVGGDGDLMDTVVPISTPPLSLSTRSADVQARHRLIRIMIKIMYKHHCYHC